MRLVRRVFEYEGWKKDKSIFLVCLNVIGNDWMLGSIEYVGKREEFFGSIVFMKN